MRAYSLMFAVVALGAANVSLATPVTFEFQGSVVSNNLLQAPWNGVAVGAPVTVTFTFDSLTADSNPSGLQGNYNGTISNMTVTMGVATESVLAGSIQVSNFAGPGPGADQYRPAAALTNGIDFSVQLSSEFGDCGPLQTDALPTVVDLSQWINKHGELCNYSVGRCVSVTWSSFRIVPCDGDADHNNTVNFADVTSVLTNFLSGCD